MTFIKELTPRTSDFILDNIIRRNLLNKAFLEELRRILVNEFNVQDFVKKIVFADLSNLNSVSVYDFEQRTVFVDVSQIGNELLHLVEKG